MHRLFSSVFHKGVCGMALSASLPLGGFLASSSSSSAAPAAPSSSSALDTLFRWLADEGQVRMYIHHHWMIDVSVYE